MQELQQELDKISKEIEDSNYKKLDLDFIESLLEKCADIRELDSNEQRLLIGVLVDKILWDGNTQDVTVYFIGSGDIKKKVDSLLPDSFQLLQIQPHSMSSI